MEIAEKENNNVYAGWMAPGKHGRNNTIESRLLIKAGNLAKLVPARRAASANQTRALVIFITAHLRLGLAGH